MIDFEDNNTNDFNPVLALLICKLLEPDIELLNERIDITVKPTYFFINDIYFYNILLALHINENAKFIKKSDMPMDELVHIIERDTYLKINKGKDIDF